MVDRNTQKNYIYNKNPQEQLEQTLLEQYELLDTVMSIPISDRIQIRIVIYKQLMDQKLILDIRNYKLLGNKFRPYNGLRIPFENLEQLVIRLQRLNSKYNKKKEEFKILL